MYPIEDIREQFPQAKKEIYLDTAASSLKPKCVIDALSHFYLESYATVHRGAYSTSQRASQKYFETRLAIAKFLNAQSEEEIVFTKNATEAINLVARSYGSFLLPGDEIILSEMEHHSNLVPWQILANEKNVILKFIPVDECGELILEEYEKLLCSKTKLVSIAHIANVAGTIHPISYIIKRAHEYKAKVLVDGAQAAAHIPVDVRQLDADFYCFSAHKSYGPGCVGVLYGKKDLLKQMPPVSGGGDMIEEVSLTHSFYQDPPMKFEAGTPAIAEVIAFKESINYLQTIGIENIFAHEKSLIDRLTKNLSEIEEVSFIGTAKEKGAILSFTIDKIHPLDLASFLDMKNIAIRTGHMCAQPYLRVLGIPSVARASVGMYNTLDEMDQFSEAVFQVMRKLAVHE